MMNSSNIISDFFEPVDCFKNKIAANKQCQEQQDCEHSLMILEKPCPKPEPDRKLFLNSLIISKIIYTLIIFNKKTLPKWKGFFS